MSLIANICFTLLLLCLDRSIAIILSDSISLALFMQQEVSKYWIIQTLTERCKYAYSDKLLQQVTRDLLSISLFLAPNEKKWIQLLLHFWHYLKSPQYDILPSLPWRAYLIAIHLFALLCFVYRDQRNDNNLAEQYFTGLINTSGS